MPAANDSFLVLERLGKRVAGNLSVTSVGHDARRVTCPTTAPAAALSLTSLLLFSFPTLPGRTLPRSHNET